MLKLYKILILNPLFITKKWEGEILVMDLFIRKLNNINVSFNFTVFHYDIPHASIRYDDIFKRIIIIRNFFYLLAFFFFFINFLRKKNINNDSTNYYFLLLQKIYYVSLFLL